MPVSMLCEEQCYLSCCAGSKTYIISKASSRVVLMLQPKVVRLAALSSYCTAKSRDRAVYRYVHRAVQVTSVGVLIDIHDTIAGPFTFQSSKSVRLKPQRTMGFSNSARGVRRGATSRMTPVLLCLALLMTTGCMAEERLNALPEDYTKLQVFTFSTDGDFNISTKLGFYAPKCSRFCYPWPADHFIDYKVPCAEHEVEGNNKWVPCLCTHRPFMRYLVNCIFQKCGPAIVAAFEFGYQICADYNITFPPPPEAVVDLNITVPNDAITIPTTIPKMPFPFAKELPPAVHGGSTSDENPPQRLNESLHSTACQGKSNLFGIWEEGSQRRLRQATVALWLAMTVGLGAGFIGL
ncbi:hypothetical protein EV426DRAFT_290034 [Tirmania nivea]|nr:hypothetical protein EV426DRAFT_290034 [Tirmania nivea]